MSVYTSVRPDELVEFLARYEQGALVSYQGIKEGIENTNYFVTTEQGEYVLTVFEKHGPDELPYFLDLMAHLAERGVPCPHPIPGRDGAYLQQINDMPAALVQRLRGRSPEQPSIEQCRAVGAALGHMHLAGKDFGEHRPNDRGPRWWRETSEVVLPLLGEEDAALLREEIRFQGLYRFADLPRGVIHGDLFRDNVMFEDDELTGIIDFYYACDDVWLYDLAITVNDWCSRDDSSLDTERLGAVLSAYHEQRPLKAIERGAWPVMLRAAALRFWLSRLYDLHFPRAGEITHIKDPDVFKSILQDRIANEVVLQREWV